MDAFIDGQTYCSLVRIGCNMSNFEIIKEITDDKGYICAKVPLIEDVLAYIKKTYKFYPEILFNHDADKWYYKVFYRNNKGLLESILTSDFIYTSRHDTSLSVINAICNIIDKDRHYTC